MPDSDLHHEQLTEAANLEENGQQLFGSRNIEEAFQAFREAGLLYRHANHHLKALRCFSLASDCEKIRTGVQSVREAALMSKLAAEEAVKAGKLADAKWLFRDAGLLYEKEGEYEEYSECFIEAQETHMLYLKDIFMRGKKQQRFGKKELDVTHFERLKAFISWNLSWISKFVWGFGEAPMQPLVVAMGIIAMATILFYKGGLIRSFETVRQASLVEALYLSGVTFTTVGYGDLVPTGWLRMVAIFEAFSGVCLIPLFVIALTRRYLRVYR